MPVGGSMSASALIVAAGARTRLALFIAAAVMALLILVASGVVSLVAMPALAGLLIVVGMQAIKPARILSVAKTGPLQTTVMGVTFVLTLVIPLQFAVLLGVGLAIILFVAQQSNRLRVRQLEFHADGRLREVDPMAAVPPHDVVVLQPYGNLSYATRPCLRGAAAEGRRDSRGSVVIVRLRGIDELGLSSSRCSTATSTTSNSTAPRSGSWSRVNGSPTSSLPAACSIASAPIASTRARSGSARRCTGRTATRGTG